MSQRKTPVTFGHARFTVYSKGCVRLEYSHGARFSSFPSLLVGPEQARGVAADVSIKGNSLTIRTEIFCRISHGIWAKSAVIPSIDVTARMQTA